jgi:predicted dehydrogenase
MLRIGVLGVGHLGKIHLRCLQELKEQFDLVTFFDHQMAAAKEAVELTGLMPSHSVDHLLDQVDAVVITVPTVAHYKMAIQAVRKFKHVFIEKPVCADMEEARSLLKLVREAEVTCQVCHIERFNPVFVAAMPFISQPSFIESRRLMPSHHRGLDVSVILDLMIHDIDLVLKITGAAVRKITANGSSVFSSMIDVANVRLELDNGAVAQLTASRIHHEAERKMTIYQRDQYLKLDFLEHHLERVDAAGQAKGQTHTIKVNSVNAIQQELKSFHESVVTRKEPVVSLEDGLRALDIALQATSLSESSTMVGDERVFSADSEQ